MKYAAATLLSLLLLLAGCDRSAPPRSGGDPAGEEPLRLTPHSTDSGLMALRIENTSETPLILSRGVDIEALEIFGASYQDYELVEYGVEGSAFFLISSCGEPTGGCFTLEPGASLQTVPWSGFYASPQCFEQTPSDYAAPSGRYRFAVRACNGGERFFSPPFDQRAVEQ